MHTLFHIFSGGNITCFCSMIMGQKLFWTKLNTVCFICFSRRITACFCSCLKLTINKIINQRNKLFLVLICLWLVLHKTWFIVARTLAFNLSIVNILQQKVSSRMFMGYTSHRSWNYWKCACRDLLMLLILFHFNKEEYWCGFKMTVYKLTQILLLLQAIFMYTFQIFWINRAS